MLTREYLRAVVSDVRKHIDGVTVSRAWVHRASFDQWEFHFEDFYWHGGAWDAYDARAKGWSAYLAKKGVKGYAAESMG